MTDQRPRLSTVSITTECPECQHDFTVCEAINYDCCFDAVEPHKPEFTSKELDYLLRRSSK